MKLITNIIVFISSILILYYLYLHIMPFNIGKELFGIVSIIFLLIPVLIEKIFKIKIEKYIKLFYYFFFLVAFILGILFNLYYSTSFFDLLVHGLFGFLISIILLKKIKLKNYKKILLTIVIIISLGFLWECLEFFSDILLKTDHQEKISGATDTMTDILLSIIGSSIYITMNKIKR